jgi:hypothetical protein
VAHSEGTGAPLQVLEVGAISRSMETAESPGARVARENEGWGMGVEVVRVAIARVAAVMIESCISYCGLEVVCGVMNCLLRGKTEIEG